MNSSDQKPSAVEDVPTVKSQESGFESKIREIDEYYDMVEETTALLEKKIGPLTQENIFTKAQGLLSDDEIDLIDVVSLADRGNSDMREVMKQHIMNGDMDRGSISPYWLAAVKSILGKLKYE